MSVWPTNMWSALQIMGVAMDPRLSVYESEEEIPIFSLRPGSMARGVYGAAHQWVPLWGSAQWLLMDQAYPGRVSVSEVLTTEADTFRNQVGMTPNQCIDVHLRDGYLNTELPELFGRTMDRIEGTLQQPGFQYMQLAEIQAILQEEIGKIFRFA